MIHYSPIPLEFIFDGYSDMKLNYKEVQMGHLTMVLEQVSESESRIVRLISPNAQDYLNPHYQPGTIIHSNPSI